VGLDSEKVYLSQVHPRSEKTKSKLPKRNTPARERFIAMVQTNALQKGGGEKSGELKRKKGDYKTRSKKATNSSRAAMLKKPDLTAGGKEGPLKEKDVAEESLNKALQKRCEIAGKQAQISLASCYGRAVKSQK